MQLHQVLLLGLAFVACASAATYIDENSPTNLLITEEEMQQLMKYKVEIGNWILGGMSGGRSTGRFTDNESKALIDCPICRTAIGIAINLIHSGASAQQIANAVIFVCVSLNIVHREVCVGAVNLYVDPLMYMFDHHPWLTVNDVCGFMLAEEGCGEVNHTMTDWDVEIDDNKRPIVLYPRLPDDIPTLKVIHMTDIHPDLHYTEGSNTKCGKPLCCRPTPEDDPSNSSIAAGFWGDYACDLPQAAMINIFEEAAARHRDADFVLMTGDLVHHQVWNTTVEDNLLHYDSVNNAILAAFPDKPVYPVIGNHEPHPCNMFPPSEIWADYNISYVYNSIADAYAGSLTPEALVTFRRAGYYTIVHKPGFRLIFLNTNFCYLNNFWLLYDAADPEGQLQWFADTLLVAEQSNEQVWVVGHVPPGSGDCWPVWSNKFVDIINRFEAIVKAQYYGHTHNDDFRVFFDHSANPPRPTNSLFIGASATPYTDLNPGYKVFYTDGVRENATWEITDHETWIYNLTLANLGNGDPTAIEWFKLYNAKEDFGLLSFRPNDLYDFVVRMVTDDDLFQKFYTYYNKGSDTMSSCTTHECKMNQLCSIVKTDYEITSCERLETVYNNHMRQF